MFKKILVVNRGEINKRIQMTAQLMKIDTVFFDSQNPRDFFDITKIIDFAKKQKVDAIHPGYGFLSENAEFAATVQKNNLNFIGPNADFLKIFGNKNETTKLFNSHDIKTIPEVDENQLPAMLKMSDGAGGKGTFVVSSKEELKDVNGQYRLEKIIENARQIEIQVVSNGSDIEIIGIRDGSVQIRNQKMIEFSVAPSFFNFKQMIPKLNNIFSGYIGLATIEFLFDVDIKELYFMEVNPRIQVEHTVTEESTENDLVRIQIELAAGIDTSFNAEFKKYAIEARVLAIDSNTLMPTPGRITSVNLPNTIRIDNGFLYKNEDISPFFDPLLAKFIASGSNFKEAKQNLLDAINQTKIIGIETNLKLIKKVLEDENFDEEKITTRIIDNS